MKKRSKYKVCGRLGYNGRIRVWYGKKRKWEKVKLFRKGKKSDVSQGSLGQKSSLHSLHLESNVRFPNRIQRVNPGKRVRNEERIKGKNQSEGKTIVRIKDQYRNILRRRAGRKRRYGGVKMEKIRKDRSTQRGRYKKRKNKSDRIRRKGLNIQLRKNEERKNTRLSRVETRVDVRRWRSGRVQTLERSRDRIEHGKISRRKSNGRVGLESTKVKWQGKRRKPGEGRKIEEDTWKRRKGKRKRILENVEYEKQAVKYMEVDYITGRRYMHRRPNSGEVVIPKGRNLSKRMVKGSI